MIDRTKNRWIATIQKHTGEVIERTVEAFWRTDRVSLEEIARTAATEAHLESGKRDQFQPISAVVA